MPKPGGSVCARGDRQLNVGGKDSVQQGVFPPGMAVNASYPSRQRMVWFRLAGSCPSPARSRCWPLQLVNGLVFDEPMVKAHVIRQQEHGAVREFMAVAT